MTLNGKSLLKGKDIIVSVSGEALDGIISLETRQKKTAYDIMEFLSSTPVASINEKRTYELKLKSLSLFDEGVFEIEPFEMRVEYGSKRTVYSGCALKSVKLESASSSYMQYTYEIEALSRSTETRS